ncbi:MAG: hypothetical protein QGI00_11705 [Candidatus Marinimicrobia bacterium]|jgi:hypothetical protein|nr:hypothetical protein [Candidatus Neomarinimicrobiota bacterium]MDP7128270.1 hypothetical protein [Candidatus Neomarinimicrobiota bacterium]|tara:strand:+ start:103 stop:690 length:588 start_codon:yes stop_codon:yes gene_type:complete
MKKPILTVLSILLTIALHAQSIETELNKISGEFVGEWNLFQYSNGEIIKAASWIDTLTATNPVINDTIAYVTVKSTMTFDNSHIPPYKMEFEEGFELLDGNIVNHFFNVMGTKAIESNITENTYVIAQPISTFELNQLGFSSAIEAYHTTLKVIVIVDGVELHKVTRISTVVWESKKGNESVQFVSLKGYHKRIK